MSLFSSRSFALLAIVCVASSCSNDPAAPGGGAPTAASSQTLAITSARVLRLYQAFGNTVINDLFDDRPMPRFDGNLYSRTEVAGRVSTTSYFTDSAATASAGTIVATASNDTRELPITFEGVVGTTAGTRPATGTFTLSATDRSDIHMSGDITIRADASASGTMAIQFDSTIDGDTEMLAASATAVTSGSTVTLTGITNGVRMRPYTPFTASLRITPGDVTETVTIMIHDEDGAGSLTLSGGTSATWDAAGAGMITFPDATTYTIVNVDRGM